MSILPLPAFRFEILSKISNLFYKTLGWTSVSLPLDKTIMLRSTHNKKTFFIDSYGIFYDCHKNILYESIRRDFKQLILFIHGFMAGVASEENLKDDFLRKTINFCDKVNINDFNNKPELHKLLNYLNNIQENAKIFSVMNTDFCYLVNKKVFNRFLLWNNNLSKEFNSLLNFDSYSYMTTYKNETRLYPKDIMVSY